MSKKVMVNGEAYEVEEDKPTNPGAQEVVSHFMASDLKEDDLKSYMDLKTELEHLTEIVKQKREALLEKCRGMESAKAGNYVAFFKSVKGRQTVDWQGFVTAQIGKPSQADLAPYTKQSEDSIRIEVKKL